MKKFLGFCLAFVLCFSGLSAVWAEDATAAAADVVKKTAQEKFEQTEVSGVIQVTPADPAKNQKYATILLVSGDKQYKLLPGKDKKSFATLESMSGKTITVKGALMPATEKYPLAAIKVDEFSGASEAKSDEVKGQAVEKGKARVKGNGI
ncbi:MAG: hypothetical protein KKB51_08065 [Candidatus Riflebacteria bacterium]|nr:hypothetical protein [Candidatus Riflebacteria bacterium]